MQSNCAKAWLRERLTMTFVARSSSEDDLQSPAGCILLYSVMWCHNVINDNFCQNKTINQADQKNWSALSQQKRDKPSSPLQLPPQPCCLILFLKCYFTLSAMRVKCFYISIWGGKSESFGIVLQRVKDNVPKLETRDMLHNWNICLSTSIQI